MEKEKQLTFIDEDGNEILCEILFTFESEEFNKNYVLFYPVSEDDSDDIEVMAASYVSSENGEGELEPVETDEEWELIEDVLAQFEEREEEHDHECGCGHDHHHHDHECECEDDEDCDCEDEEDCDCEDDEEDHQCNCGHKH